MHFFFKEHELWDIKGREIYVFHVVFVFPALKEHSFKMVAFPMAKLQPKLLCFMNGKERLVSEPWFFLIFF